MRGFFGAFAGGHESGHPLLVCRAEYHGRLHPEKVVGANCNIPFGGAEELVPRLEVLYWRKE